MFTTVSYFLPKPNVTAKPNSAIEELHPVRFFCSAPNDLMITWFKDGELYTKESHLLDNNKTLLIPSVTKSDAGGYQCQITNHTSTRISDILNFNVVYFMEDKTGSYICQAGNDLLQTKRNSSSLEIYLEKSRVSNVTIKHPPEAIEGRLISLHCTSRGDSVSYSWTKGGQVVHADGRISLKNNNQTLELNPGYRNDTADYICHGNNSISSNESEPYHLDIIYGPDPLIINETIDVPKAQIKLTCKAVVHPPAVYTWFYNGTELDNRILFLKISPENSGNYTCSVINPISFLKRNTTLEINMKRKFKSLK
ncbi:carcinoembryonic antigen-related cell adhesion molecule 6-like [Notechis scutatus]|uniref:Carcinoembryonic antigen-related cell adhesion molecule 6-like n=1 Tax=Notechis scutatus TaxID=8663 RepID=A0A6J1V1W2_9SAUR|nr:carcinoembryonic antigen-related cell adhesion molecule 6-like [Notechis scutatus]